jgi:hypothetical protein
MNDFNKQNFSYQNFYPVNELMYNAFNQLIGVYLMKHSKVLPVRFDLRYPHDKIMGADNTDISKCMSKIIQKFKRDGLDPVYMWVREQALNHNPHYHCLILLNGHKTRSPEMVFDVAARLWASTICDYTNGLVHHCDKTRTGEYQVNGELIYRQDAIFPHVERQISYMAKPNGKGTLNDGLRDFGMSRIPCNHPVKLF